MGQYYKAVILGKNKKTVKEFVAPHSLQNGAKLMEHSYLGNNFVEAFQNLIYKNPQVVVWAGDYADECKGRKSNLYDRCKDKLETVKESWSKLRYMDVRYVVNHTKKLYVDTYQIKHITASWAAADCLTIHPLPLLTCEGNGRGGGDYRGEDHDGIVGSWARHLISVEPKEPIGYKEIAFNLDEK